MKIPADHPVYAHHFPGNPVVPGALLLAWVMTACEAEGHPLGRIRQCKFLQMVTPGESLALDISAVSERVSVRLTNQRGDTVLQLTASPP